MSYPRTLTKDFKADASGFIQKCIDNPFISKIPAGYYYYKKPCVLHSQIIDMQGCVFYTDQDTSFMIVRGDRPTITGYPLIDVSSVKNPTGKSVIVLSHKNDNLIDFNISVRIQSSHEQIRFTEGFDGIVFDGDTKYITVYKAGKYEMGEAHRGTINLESRYLRKALSDQNSGYSTDANFYNIIDQRSKMALDLRHGGRHIIRVEIESGNVLKESERETPYIYIGTERNRIYLAGEVGGASYPVIVNGVQFYGQKIALVNDADRNVLIENSFLVMNGQVVQNKPMTLL